MAPLYAFAGDTPAVHESAFVAPTASIIGNATLARDASAFYGVSVRADTAAITVGAGSNLQDNVVLHADPGFPCTVGAGSNLQDNVVLHADPGFPCSVGAGVSVGHAAVVHGCTVEDHCLIGMGATVLNGAVIGTGSLVAAGAVVLEGTVVPPRSLVAGVPAKVRRELTDDEFDGVRQNAARYVELARAHRGLHG
jgi:carbonic anhydrase/acetyltransferase-like protein (isoleucine patch superfamily)